MIALDELAAQIQQQRPMTLGSQSRLQLQVSGVAGAIQTGAAFIQPTHCVLFLSNYRTIPCRTQWSTNRNLTPL